MVERDLSKPSENTTNFMYPSLHQDVMDMVSLEIPSAWFHEDDDNEDTNNKYLTHVMGTFKCNNNTCSSVGWGSKKVAMLIRGYPGNGYNAVVFNQRCKSCFQLGSLSLDKKSYVDRIAYRIRRWAGFLMEQPYYASNQGPPHERELCEGCKQGLCRQ
jgi:hypothetical protein